VKHEFAGLREPLAHQPALPDVRVDIGRLAEERFVRQCRRGDSGIPAGPQQTQDCSSMDIDAVGTRQAAGIRRAARGNPNGTGRPVRLQKLREDCATETLPDNDSRPAWRRPP